VCSFVSSFIPQANKGVNEAFMALVREMAKVHGKGPEKKKKKGFFFFGK